MVRNPGESNRSVSRREALRQLARGAVAGTAFFVAYAAAPIEAEAACAPHGNPDMMDAMCGQNDAAGNYYQDGQCNDMAAGGPNVHKDDKCGTAILSAPGTFDPDQSCGKVKSAQAIWTDGDCQKGTGQNYNEDNVCGATVNGAKLPDAHCGNPVAGANHDEDQHCGTKVGTVYPADGNCGNRTSSGAYDEDDRCGQGPANGPAEHDAHCGDDAGADQTDQDLNCGTSTAGDPNPETDESCGTTTTMAMYQEDMECNTRDTDNALNPDGACGDNDTVDPEFKDKDDACKERNLNGHESGDASCGYMIGQNARDDDGDCNKYNGEGVAHTNDVRCGKEDPTGGSFTDSSCDQGNGEYVSNDAYCGTEETEGEVAPDQVCGEEVSAGVFDSDQSCDLKAFDDMVWADGHCADPTGGGNPPPLSPDGSCGKEVFSAPSPDEDDRCTQPSPSDPEYGDDAAE